MLVELSIIPVGKDAHISDELAEVVKMIDESGLPYELTPSATCIEGEWEELMPLIRRCHDRMRAFAPHVITHITIEDDAGAHNMLSANIAAIEEKVGHPLRRNHSSRISPK